MGLKQTTTHKYIRDRSSVNIQRILMRIQYWRLANLRGKAVPSEF